MAYINDPSGGRTGPYWRRQMGTTLPGEHTSAQLAMINLARQRLGLEPLGGPGPGRGAVPGGAQARPRVGLRHAIEVGGLHEAQPAPPVQRPVDEGRVAIPEIGQNPIERPGIPDEGLIPLPQPVQGGGRVAAPAQEDPEALRQRLLAQFQGAVQPNYSRDALRQYVQQHMQRRAVGGGGPRRPILPQRQARKALPY